jgi:hypothetical protein
VRCVILYIPDVVLGAGEAMRRREFIAFVGSVAAAWPIAARARPVPILGYAANKNTDPKRALAQDRTFGGFDCTLDCSGHSAGYKWAERKGITDEANCPDGNSQSFHEGGVAYTQGQVADPDEDDDGGAVGHRGRRHSLSSSSSAGIFRG